jgi:hypothetical protein
MTEQEFNEVALVYKYHEPFVPFFVETKNGREFYLDKDAGLIWNPPAVGVISSDDMIYDFWIEDMVKFRPANHELL